MASSGEVLDFEDYVRNRQDALLRSARRLVPDPIEAQDLLQTALVRTLGRWDGIADKSLADAYLRRVMINTRTEWWRARKLDEVPTDELPDARVEDGTEQHADRALLMDILSCLAPKQRSVVVLRHWEQMSTEETAEALGMSTGTVKSTLHRALARLRQELESRDLDAVALERAERRGTSEPASAASAATTVPAARGPRAGADARVNGGPGVARPAAARTQAAAARTQPAATRTRSAARPQTGAPALPQAGARRPAVAAPAPAVARPATHAVPLGGVVRQRQPLGERPGRAPERAAARVERPMGPVGAVHPTGTVSPVSAVGPVGAVSAAPGHGHKDRRERHDRGQARCAA